MEKHLFTCVMRNIGRLQHTTLNWLIECRGCTRRWVDVLCLEWNLGPRRPSPFGTLESSPPQSVRYQGQGISKIISKTCLTWEVWLYSGLLWDKWMCSTVPWATWFHSWFCLPLNLRRLISWRFMSNCPGGGLVLRLKSGPPRNRSYYKGNMTTTVVRQIILVQFPVSQVKLPGIGIRMSFLSPAWHMTDWIQELSTSSGFKTPATDSMDDTVPFRMRFLCLKDLGSDKAWHLFFRLFLVLECLFWLV